MNLLNNFSSLEKSIYDLLNQTAIDLGYEIVTVKYTGTSRKVLDIAIDTLPNSLSSGSITIRDCKNASNAFSAVLDVEELIKDKYFLEVGSSGVERPLVKTQDFERFKGRTVKIRLQNPYKDLKNFQCVLMGIKDNKALVRLVNGELAEFDFDNIKTAKLVFTEDMFRESLNKDKTTQK